MNDFNDSKYLVMIDVIEEEKKNVEKEKKMLEQVGDHICAVASFFFFLIWI